MLEFIAFIFLGALWRLAKGADVPSSNIGRIALGRALGALAGHPDGWHMVAGALSFAILMPGRTRWEDPLWMATRFGAPALVPWAIVVASGTPQGPLWGLWYPALYAAAGVSYWLFLKVDSKLPRRGWITGWTSYGEMFAGAAAGAVCGL